MKDIKEIFYPKFIKRGGLFLLNKKDSFDFIAECEKTSINILGIDGFNILSDKYIRPTLNHSIDFTGSIIYSSIYESAKRLVSEDDDNGEELFYEFTL